MFGGHYEKLSRKELYELVWSMPASQVCERFGMSGRGLAKLCERYEIPVPERGWWAKKAAGHEVKRQPLSPIKNAYLETIEVYVREDFRSYLTPAELEKFEQRLTDEASLPPPSIPEADESRHPLIVRSRRKHHTAPTEGPLYIAISVSDALREMALRIATALVEACEKRGYTFQPKEGAVGGVATVEVLGHSIGLSIVEPPRRVPHVLTRAEAREKAVGRGWNIPEHDEVPSGEIAIVLDHAVSGERNTFSGGAGGFESPLAQLMKTLLRVAMRLQAEKNFEAERRHQEHEESERRRQEEQRRRENQERIAAERRRRRKLFRQSVRFQQTAALRQMITAIEQISDGKIDESARADWLSYANHVADSLDPVPRIIDSMSAPRADKVSYSVEPEE